MKLLPPSVVPPLSPCSRKVRVINQLKGYKVTLYSNGNLVGQGNANSSDEYFDLDPTASLTIGAFVTAQQSYLSDKSDLSEAVQVQLSNSTSGAVSIRSHVYECGECLYIAGALPGATVEVYGSKHGLLGSAEALDGTARVGLSSSIEVGEVISANQIGCGQPPGPMTASPPADPFPHVGIGAPRLPDLSIIGPLYECDTHVTVGSVMCGADVMLKRSSGPTEMGCFELGQETFLMSRPLVKGESIMATQTLIKCETSPSEPTVSTVLSAQQIPAPALRPPICMGDRFVQIDGIRPGAQIHIYQDGLDLGVAESANGGSVTQEVPPLMPGAKVYVQEIIVCANVTKNSNTVTVLGAPRVLPLPKIPGPLYQCGTKVLVVNILPGSRCSVYSKNRGLLSSTYVKGSQMGMDVTPGLDAGDFLHAEVNACGQVAVGPQTKVNSMDGLHLPVVRGPISECASSIIVDNVTPGAKVEVHSTAGWWSDAIAVDIVVEVPLGGVLRDGDLLRARQILCADVTPMGPAASVKEGVVYVTTQHNDDNRSGANLCETVLNTTNVNKAKFGLLFSRQVDGDIYAQPLYVPNVVIKGVGSRNVIFVATMHNSIYAFDAEDPVASAPLWPKASLGPSFVIPQTSPPQPIVDQYKWSNFNREIGIVSTPVIDLATQTMYVVAFTNVGGKQHHHLHALDITTGRDKLPPRQIQASISGTGQGSVNGMITFNSSIQNQRSALALANGMVYFAFSSLADNPGDNWQGWVLGYDRVTLEQMAVFCSSPSSGQAGIWMSGQGPVIDDDGNLYVITGNSVASINPPQDGDWGESFVKLTPSGCAFDWFTPHNFKDLNTGDLDLGSGGPMMIPGTRLLVGGGKPGILYVLDTRGPQSMGHFSTNPTDVPPAVQAFHAVNMYPHNVEIHGAPVFWWGPVGGIMYIWGQWELAKAFVWSSPHFQTTPASTSPASTSLAPPVKGIGGILSISAHGSAAGSGIVWANRAEADDDQPSYHPGRPNGVLHAFDAANLSHELWNSNMNPHDLLGSFAKNCPPTIAAGRVYMATSSNQLVVYGLI